MKTTFLDYYKTILDRVSFDKELTQKEYRKAINTLNADEIDEFERWIQQRGLKLQMLRERSR